MNEIEIITEKLFESIKHVDEFGNEYWEARELQKVLGYVQWRRMEEVIERAQIACVNSGYIVDYQFASIGKLIIHAKGGKRIIQDYKLSRYACYLIMMEADSRKQVVALGKTYFAIQTRRSELRDKSFESLSEDNKRLILREETRKGNKELNREAIKKGVRDLAKFTNAGYKGLYNGETADDIAKRKQLRYREEILDHMGSEELAANAFRITQTEAALKRQEEVSGVLANKTHYNVGLEVRNTIKRLNGTMPEDLLTPDKSIKELDKDKVSILEEE